LRTLAHHAQLDILPMLCPRAALALTIALPALSASAQIYSGRTADGTVVLSDFRGTATPTLLVSASVPASAISARRQAISSIVDDVAREMEVPVHLLHAVISVESGYNAKAVSPKGAQGLMQLMPETARRFGVADPFDPFENVRGGALYLKWLLDVFRGDMSLALAGYNAGEQAVIRAGYRIPPYAETQRYVPRVMARLPRPGQG
jgi:soluble lytic murein transglycosylase-like protein